MLFCSCRNIWEERAKCPATICVITEDSPYELKTLELWAYDSNGELLARDTVATGKTGYVKKVKVRRGGEVSCFLWGNIGMNTRVSGTTYTDHLLENIGKSTADSLFYFGRIVSLNADTAVVNLHMQKYFAEVRVNFIGVSPTEAVELKLEGKSRGYDISGVPAGGEFSQTNRSEGGSSLRFRILRQSDIESLSFDISYICEGGHTDTFDFRFGHYLKQMGYDMQSADMQDITLTFDYTSLTAVIQFGQWQVCVPVCIEF